MAVFSDGIGSFNRFIRSNFSNELKNGRARFQYLLPLSYIEDLIYYIVPTLEEGKFDTEVIHIGINDMLSNISEADSVLQNIPKIPAKCKSHDVTKFFISNLLCTRKVSKDIIHKVNSSISNICKEHVLFY